MISCGQNNLNFVSTVVKRWKTITIYCIKAHFNLREFKTLRGSLTLALALFHSSHLSRLLTGYFSLSLSLSLSSLCFFCYFLCNQTEILTLVDFSQLQIHWFGTIASKSCIYSHFYLSKPLIRYLLYIDESNFTFSLKT